ncbi:glycoside hydrolase family 65 protein [Paenibacillus psychroresistens]|uniref:Glycoside hydrolase family 65 protein n=1 Tax=Paenibacillus psychroresistens TaxID=1778678 RepID=A0A6B8RG30_9BACL|nr:glycosyl hydrolase family 65 protein [Paenibacillus psychroresistens]QGQ94378.1 glycoside hydrolase family 65 protein [Paenibacillus psychroresistens]
MSWLINNLGYTEDKTAHNGSKFLIGNGYMGYRGTMDEHTKEQLVSCVLAGVYDKVGDSWREPINAPNGLFTTLNCDGEVLTVQSSQLEKHEQVLDIKHAIHTRETIFEVSNGNLVHLKSDRFFSLDDIHLVGLQLTFSAVQDCTIVIETGIDGDVWDINGPHLSQLATGATNGIIHMSALTQEMGYQVAVSEAIEIDFAAKQQIITAPQSILRQITVEATAGEEYTFNKYVSVFTSLDSVEDAGHAAQLSCHNALKSGYDTLLLNHKQQWVKYWEKADISIVGDDDAQLALRYSMYHLLVIAPHSEKVSIPARGLSGQVYKGAVFWDTEMFMLPFFVYTNPEIARRLVKYRCHTLGGARLKAIEYGFRGAYYAWESQDTGEDACTLFNITDVFTNRPMRTYFRDKQVHISGDVAYGLWKYYTLTGDESILLDGGAEVILECARFFYSYAYFNKDKNRYEILDVTGPDEYHERVNNNIFTNQMVKYTLEVALQTLDLLERKYGEEYSKLINQLNYQADIAHIHEMNELLYMPQPDSESLVIEQFDGYHKLEDVNLKELKTRVIHPNEYYGGGNGIATSTKIIKQADTIAMLNMFKNNYSHEVKKANWSYYEPRTEHGSSLSHCLYSLVAADIGNAEWGYKYFMKSATIDLTGESKQYVGTLYIGGTHPAANGGAWMSAVLGFAGVNANEHQILINPKLPDKWESIAFNLSWKGQKMSITITKLAIVIRADRTNTATLPFEINGEAIECQTGQELSLNFHYDRSII